MQKNSYEVEILIHGKPAKEYAHKGQFYIEGRKETPFSIRLRNNSYQRKLFIPTIDGLSVMDGKEGSFTSSGYIVPAHSTVTIEGWRVSDKDVASFYFSSPNKSYRKRMKKGNNLGIIGVAVFDEKSPFYYTSGSNTISNAGLGYGVITSTSGSNLHFNPGIYGGDGGGGWGCGGTNAFYSATAGASLSASLTSASVGSAQTQQLGTGWGEQRTSEVISVNFDQVATPSAIFEIHYSTREQLEGLGINFKKEPLYVTPQAFPGNYCEPPRH